MHHQRQVGRINQTKIDEHDTDGAKIHQCEEDPRVYDEDGNQHRMHNSRAHADDDEEDDDLPLVTTQRSQHEQRAMLRIQQQQIDAQVVGLEAEAATARRIAEEAEAKVARARAKSQRVAAKLLELDGDRLPDENKLKPKTSSCVNQVSDLSNIGKRRKPTGESFPEILATAAAATADGRQDCGDILYSDQDRNDDGGKVSAVRGQQRTQAKLCAMPTGSIVVTQHTTGAQQGGVEAELSNIHRNEQEALAALFPTTAMVPNNPNVAAGAQTVNYGNISQLLQLQQHHNQVQQQTQHQQKQQASWNSFHRF